MGQLQTEKEIAHGALVQSSQGHLHTANAKLLNKDSVTSYPKGACQARKQPTKKKFFLSLSLFLEHIWLQVISYAYKLFRWIAAIKLYTYRCIASRISCCKKA